MNFDSTDLIDPLTLAGPRVLETNTHIIIEGVKVNLLLQDIQSKWKTSRLRTYMFSNIGWKKAVLPKFFLFDLMYMTRTLLEERYTRLSKHYYRKLVAALEETPSAKRMLSTDLPKRLDKSRLSVMSKVLFSHQDEYLDYYDQQTARFNLKGYLLTFPVGKGKTLAAVAVGVAAGCDGHLVICPQNNVNDAWVSEFTSSMKVPPKIWTTGMPESELPGSTVRIVHYEALDRLDRIIKADEFKNLIITVDEAHGFNNPNSLRSARLAEHVNRLEPKHFLWTTGTFFKQIGSEAEMFLSIADPLFNEFTAERFKKIYVGENNAANEILAARMGQLTYTRADLHESKRTREVTTINVKLPNNGGDAFTLDAARTAMSKFAEERSEYYRQHMQEYETYIDHCFKVHAGTLRTPAEKAEYERYLRSFAEVRKRYDPQGGKDDIRACKLYEHNAIVPSLPKDMRPKFRDCITVVKYVKQRILGEALGKVLMQMQVDCHLAMIRHTDFKSIIDSSPTKTIIFTDFVPLVTALDVQLKSLGYSPVLFYGETNHDFDGNLKRFASDTRANPGIGTYASISTGVRMTMASTIICINQPFRPHILEQANGRIDREGQTEAVVRYFNLLLDTGNVANVSTRRDEIQKWSKSQVESLLGIGHVGDSELALESMVPMQGNGWVLKLLKEYPKTRYQIKK